MRSLRIVILLASLPLSGMPASAQRAEPVLDREAAGQAEVPGGGGRNEIALDVGYFAAGLSFARSVGASPLSLGGGVWGAWEPANSFERNLWEPLGATVFGRYRPASWMQGDVGLTGARYLWADDCSDCSGTFLGARAAALFGQRGIFVGPEIALGWARDGHNGREFGALWGAQARFPYRCGR